jgi:hypothetical protein
MLSISQSKFDDVMNRRVDYPGRVMVVVVLTADGARYGKLSVCRKVRRRIGYIAVAGAVMDKRQEGARQ